MKYIIIISTALLTIASGCSKSKMENDGDKEDTFTFRVKKNDDHWAVNTALGFRQSNDSTYYVEGWGENNERITFDFKRSPTFTGKLEKFGAGVIVPNCEHCAGIIAKYSLDSTKENRLEIVGFDTIEGRVLGKFSIHLKKDSIYAGPFTEEFNKYEGVFSVVYKETTP